MNFNEGHSQEQNTDQLCCFRPGQGEFDRSC